MNWKNKKIHPAPARWMSVALAVCIFVGILGGQAAVRVVPSTLQAELNRYLTNFLQLSSDQISSAETVRNTLMLYFRYPLMAFFASFSFIGVIFLPCLAFLFGLGLSFSSGCFTAAFGTSGLLIACASFGLRTLVTIPCFLAAATSAWDASFRLLALSFGRGQRFGSGVSRLPMRLCLPPILGVLLAGAFADLLLTPRFLHLVLT